MTLLTLPTGICYLEFGVFDTNYDIALITLQETLVSIWVATFRFNSSRRPKTIHIIFKVKKISQ
jgi:hypothetical protein